MGTLITVHRQLRPSTSFSAFSRYPLAETKASPDHQGCGAGRRQARGRYHRGDFQTVVSAAAALWCGGGPTGGDRAVTPLGGLAAGQGVTDNDAETAGAAAVAAAAAARGDSEHVQTGAAQRAVHTAPVCNRRRVTETHASELDAAAAESRTRAAETRACLSPRRDADAPDVKSIRRVLHEA